MGERRPWRVHLKTGRVSTRASLDAALRTLFPTYTWTTAEATRVTRDGWSGAVEAAGPRLHHGVRIVPDAVDRAVSGNQDADKWREEIRRTSLYGMRPGGNHFLRDDPDQMESWG